MDTNSGKKENFKKIFRFNRNFETFQSGNDGAC